MTVDEIVAKFVANPSRMRPGATSLAKRFRCEKNDIYEARKKARAIIKGEVKEEKQDEETISEKEIIDNDESYCVEVTLNGKVVEQRTFWKKLTSLITFNGWK